MIHRPARVVSGALIARPSRTCGALHSTACRPHRQPRHYSERALLVERPCPCLEVVSVVALLAHYAHCLQVSACQAAAISLNRLITTSLQALSARLERAQIRPIRRESSHTLNGDYMSSALAPCDISGVGIVFSFDISIEALVARARPSGSLCLRSYIYPYPTVIHVPMVLDPSTLCRLHVHIAAR